MNGYRNSLLGILLCIQVCLGGGFTGYLGAERLTAKPEPVTPDASPTLNASALQATTDYGTHLPATIQALEAGRLFEDPWFFSSNEEDNDDETISNTDLGLMLTIKVYRIKAWAVASAEDLPQDVDVSVTAQGLTADTCDGWSYSLNIRHHSDETPGNVSFYEFMVSNNRLWLFEWYDGRGFGSRVLANGSIKQDFDIHQPNRLRIVAVGKHFDLYVNDQKVGAVDDPDAAVSRNNRVSVAMETCSKPVSALFSDLIVKTPE